MFVDFPIGGFGLVFNSVDILFIEGCGFLLRCHGWFAIKFDDGVLL